MAILLDTNLLIGHIRRQQSVPTDTIVSVVVAGELEAFALKADWGYQKVSFLRQLLRTQPVLEVSRAFTDAYARLDAYSQGKLTALPLPPGLTARNMGKNDLWLAATALYFASSCTRPTRTLTTWGRSGYAWCGNSPKTAP